MKWWSNENWSNCAFSLEQAMWYIGLDELVEITPKAIRMRKKYLTESQRTIARKQGLL